MEQQLIDDVSIAWHGPARIFTAAPSSGAATLGAWLTRHPAVVRRELGSAGALLFRGFTIAGRADLAGLTSSLGGTLADYRGGDSPRDLLGDGVYTSTRLGSDYHIPPHNELSYSTRYPRLITFFCDRPADQGGATLLADGRRAYEALDRALAEDLMRRRITYVQNLCDGFGLGKSWQDTFAECDRTCVERYLLEIGARFAWRADGGLHVEETVDPIVRHPDTQAHVLFCQADQWHPSALDAETRAVLADALGPDGFIHDCRFGDGDEIPADTIDSMRDAISASTIELMLERGDWLVLDNLMMLHGRGPFQGERRILVTMGQFHDGERRDV